MNLSRALPATIAAVAALCGGAILCGPAAASDRPNVVVILADDLGWGDLACYGHPKFKTPHLNALAVAGVRFTQAYAPTPYCSPSRAAIMTGRHPLRCGLTIVPLLNGKSGLAVTERTLAQVLREAGYATACLGKWHLGWASPEHRPTARGFDQFYGLPVGTGGGERTELFDGEKAIEYPVVLTTLTRRLTERATAFIEQNRERPFFLFFSHFHVHMPLVPGERFYKRTETGLYGDTVAELDWSVGEVMRTRARLNLQEKTLVIFTSDNGPWYGGSTGGLRGMKGETWEGGVRVPLIASWKGTAQAGRVRDIPVCLMDVFPTALAAAGVPRPKDVTLDGADRMPLLEGEPAAVHQALFFSKGNKLLSVRNGRWKLHLANPGVVKNPNWKQDGISFADPRTKPEWKPGEFWINTRGADGVTVLGPFEQPQPQEHPGIQKGDAVTDVGLFDLIADPAEQHNVAVKHPDIVRRLREEAERFLAGTKPSLR